jgi:hypothetical protein
VNDETRKKNEKHLHALGLKAWYLYNAYAALEREWQKEGSPTGLGGCWETRETLFAIGDALYLVTGDEAYAGQRLEGEA